jgi:gamma-butyrobetaine dioxygenase
MRPSMLWRTAVRLRDAGLIVDTPKLSKHSLPFAWLRDACPCTRCVHPSTRQKLFATSDLPPDIAPLSATNAAAVRENALHVQWSDGHASAYPLPFLERYATEESTQAFHHDVVPVPWDTASVRSSPTLFTDYATLATSEGRLAAYEQVVRYGLLFVRGVPTAETNDASCELRTLAGRFGEIRRTFYGETWDVQSVKESKNIAYTNLDLGLHMDLLCVRFSICVRALMEYVSSYRYYRHPPRYQILHCLRNRVKGGTSLFVDAFHAAAALSPEHFATLSSTPIPFHYVNDGHHLEHSHRTLELEPSVAGAQPALRHVNYSPPFQAPLARAHASPALFSGLRAFARALAAPERMLRHRLREGEAVLFDNRRVLHARTAFGDAVEGAEAEDQDVGELPPVRDGEPDRWLKGCYLEADALLDRRRVMLDALARDE